MTTRRSSTLMCALAASLSALLAQPAAVQAGADELACLLEGSGTELRGTCEVPCMVNALAIDVDGPNPKVSCGEPDRRVAAMLKADARTRHWLGTMEGKHPEDPTRFELLPGPGGAGGVAKTPFGWFAVQSWRRTDDALALRVDAGRTLPPTADDTRIIERARALVADESRWNRQDDRVCRPDPTRWSLFCALTQATTEISGGVHYRQPALQVVREVLNEIGGDRLQKHRLMDYNNHPDTTLADIHGLLRTAQTRLEAGTK